MAAIVAPRRVVALAMLLCMAAGVGRVAGAKRQRQRRGVEPLTGPTEDQIWDSGLVEKELSYATLLEKGRQYYSDTEARRFKGFVLAYVTPWNKAGYENAVTFRHKLDAVSPVWFQIKPGKDNGKPEITGGHDVNNTWIGELKKGGKGPLVVPRFIIEAEPEGQLQLLREGRALLEELGTVVLGHGFDGLVLEAWSGWQSMNGIANREFKRMAMQFVEALGAMMHGNGGKKLFMAVPPLYPAHEKAPWLDRNDLIKLSSSVDGLSVMTYDFSMASGRAGPNSPLPWVIDNLNLLAKGSGPADPALPDAARTGFLMGVNFYGWDFSNTRNGLAAVTADGLQKVLQKHEPALQWEEGPGEHKIEYTDKSGFLHQVWYPSPRSLELRVQAARDAGVGISIWELGQGLERFFDLL